MAPKFIWSLQGGGTSAIAGIAAASGPLLSGLCDYVAIGYGDSALSYAKRAQLRPDRLMPDNGAAYGIMGPAADHALAARRHMHEFGTTKEQLGAVALSARDYAAKRPDAYLHDRRSACRTTSTRARSPSRSASTTAASSPTGDVPSS